MSFPEPFGGNNQGGYPAQQAYGAPSYGGYGQPEPQQYGQPQPGYGGGYPHQQGGYPHHQSYGQQPDYASQSGSQNASYQGGGESSAYQGSTTGTDPYGQPQDQPQDRVAYDEHGNPIEGGERGLGTMAMGAAAGFGANKLSGGHGGNFSSAIGGALLAQGAKMMYDRVSNNRADKKHAEQQTAAPYGGYNGGYGFGAPPGPPGPPGPPAYGGQGYGAYGSKGF